MNQKKVKQLAREMGFRGVKSRGRWDRYEVFEPTGGDAVENIGLPQLILADGETVRMAAPDEVFAYLDSLPEEDEGGDEDGPTDRPVSKSDPDRFDRIEEVEKFNPYHDSKGRFSSGNGAGTVTLAPNGKPRQYGTSDTKDAMGEIAAGGHNSLEEHLDKDGNLSPEREALHRQIIDDMLKGKIPVEGQATMTMLGGGPASGKSSVMSADTSKDPHAVTIDPDAFKEKLPGYTEMAAKTDKAAGFYHEESSLLAKRFAEVAYSENYNAIYDGTGDGSVQSVEKKIAAAKAHGYRVEAKYVTIDTEEAVTRNVKRYEDAKARGETARKPDESVVRATHAKVSSISVACAKDFDHIEIWDNNGAKGQQKMIASGGNGKGLRVVSGQEEAFRRYLAKGVKGLKGFKTLPNGEVAAED